MILDEEILRGVKKGQRKSQEILYKQYFGFAMSVCIRFAPEREDALELVNDSFLKVFEKIQQYNAELSFLAWFRRLLINTCLDAYRAKKTYLKVFEYSGELIEVPVEPDWNTELKTDVILRLFNQLPDLYRVVFNLYELENYSHDEIAAQLQISPGTSRSVLSRVKQKIRQLYAEQIKKENS